MLQAARTSRPADGEHWKRAFNFGLLIAGMGVGQGTVFAAQTWLLAQGRFALLSAFSAHYAVSTLAVLVVDSGASTILARETARTGMGAPGDIWSTFSETSLFRSLLAGAVGAAAAAYALGVTPDAFSRNYLLFCLPGWLIWSCNGGGLLDGLKLSGLGGLCGAITYAASAEIGRASCRERVWIPV